MNLVLIGLRGTGKSTVGKMLAARMNWSFMDTDTLVQERAGISIKEIFEKRGEPHFRDLETELVRYCAHFDNVVIATGGGAILREENVAALKESGFVVHLTASPAVLWHRVSQDAASRESRPKLLKESESELDELTKLMLSRAAAYAHARDVEVSVEDRSPEEVSEAILILMKARGMIGPDT